ncbi:hypothetical protein [Nocardia sp. NPDC057440]|uniref:hypothetical protein n=1 Tax=Nocardia sp. NPDC057440 TaxID=3346134 RepID=UPI003671A48A
MSVAEISEASDVPRPTISGLICEDPQRRWGSIARATAERLEAIPLPVRKPAVKPERRRKAHQDLDFLTPRVETVSDETEQQARLAVAHYAEDAEECRDLLEMLGLIKSQARPLCSECSRPYLRTAAGGYRQRGVRNGVCNPCVQAERRERQKAVNR